MYNTVRLHSAIGYVTPKDRLDGRQQAIFDERDRKLAEARDRRQQARLAQRQQPPASQAATRPSIDFAAIKAAIPIVEVLKLLGCPGRMGSTHYRGPCPLHGANRGAARCFSADLRQNLFQCFKCGCAGDAIELWAKATNQLPYDAALDLCQRLSLSLPFLPFPPSPREPVEQQPKPSTISTPHGEARP